MTAMSPWRVKAVVLLLCELLMPRGFLSAQTFQFLPEVDSYTKLTPDIRFVFQAKQTREAGDPTQAEVGPGFDFSLEPIVRLKKIAVFDLDVSKSRPLQLSVGFRWVPSPDKPDVERLTVAATPRW